MPVAVGDPMRVADPILTAVIGTCCCCCCCNDSSRGCDWAPILVGIVGVDEVRGIIEASWFGEPTVWSPNIGDGVDGLKVDGTVACTKSDKNAALSAVLVED